MTGRRPSIRSPRPPRLRSGARLLAAREPRRTVRYILKSALGAFALFVLLLLAVAHFGSASQHAGGLSFSQGKIYRPD